MCADWPPNDTELYKVKMAVLIVTGALNFTPFRSTTSLFRVTFHLEKNAPNGPTNGLEQSEVKGTPCMFYQYPRVPKLPDMCSTITHNQNLKPFCLCHFETSATNDPKWPWTVQGQKRPTYIILEPLSPKISVSLYGQPFASSVAFWDKYNERLQNNLGHYKVKGTPYMFQ